MKLKICKIGNSLGASFPKEVLDKLQVGEGDTIYVTETPDGVQLTSNSHFKLRSPISVGRV
ncbi:MAG: hypothetical protein EWV87_22405 [Microcystis panniformis Mp_GB_SS_20050300_S99]|nr:MAG: hypothetical protein EWV87_22405 [Microcystis panniformis Mp_GB_SS_20050300_S99]